MKRKASETPFQHAVTLGDLKLVKQEFKAPHAPENYAALLVAAGKGYLDVVQWLVENLEAAVYHSDGMERTPLYYAAASGHTMVVAWLIGPGRALVGKPDKMGKTPLHIAAQRGHLTTVVLLVNGGAYVNSGSTTPLYLAARSGQLSVVSYLVYFCGALIDQANVNGFTALHAAADHDNLDVVQWLLKAGANPSVRSSSGASPLYMAAQGGNLHVVETFVKHCPEVVDLCDESGDTPLQVALASGFLRTAYTKIAQCLLEKGGADASKTNNNNWTSWHFAAHRLTDAGVFESMLTSGLASVNQARHGGETPMHVAASQGNLAALRFMLVRAGASYSVLNGSAHTPFWAAVLAGHSDIVRWLISNNSAKATLRSIRETDGDDRFSSFTKDVIRGYINTYECTVVSMELLVHRIPENVGMVVGGYLEFLRWEDACVRLLL